jgi:uncharacterized protein YybS (DUF2232 family)
LKTAGGSIVYRNLVLGILICSLVFLIAGTVSVFGSIGAMLAPLPLLYYYSKLGRGQGLLVFGLSLLIVLVVMRFAHFQATLLNLCLIGSLGPILSEILRRNFSIERTIAYSVTALLALGLVVLLFYSVSEGSGPLALIEAYLVRVVEENVNIYAQLGGPSEQIEIIRSNIPRIARYIFSLFPAITLVGTSFFVWINVLAGRTLFLRNGLWYPDFGDLTRWKMPDKYVWLVIVSAVSVMLPLGDFRLFGLNILLLLMFFYFLQGLAIVSFFFRKKSVPVFVRIIGYFLIFVQQYLLLLIVGVGLIDVWADFRKLAKAPQRSE